MFYQMICPVCGSSVESGYGPDEVETIEHWPMGREVVHYVKRVTLCKAAPPRDAGKALAHLVECPKRHPWVFLSEI